MSGAHKTDNYWATSARTAIGGRRALIDEPCVAPKRRIVRSSGEDRPRPGAPGKLVTRWESSE